MWQQCMELRTSQSRFVRLYHTYLYFARHKTCTKVILWFYFLFAPFAIKTIARGQQLAHIVLRVLCFMLQIICYVFGLSSGCVAHRDAENCENVTQYMDNIYIIVLQIAVKHEDYFLWSCDICTIRDCYLVGTIFFLFRSSITSNTYFSSILLQVFF